MQKFIWVALLFIGCAGVVHGAQEQPLELASPFIDNAVLQRELKVPVWGWAEPGAKVTVAFAGQSKSVTTDEKGKWMVRLDPLVASAEERESPPGSSVSPS